MLTFFIWGWFYVTFGPFLQKLYHLNAIKFGGYIAIIEGVGNCIAMTCYIYFGSIFVKSKSNVDKTSYIQTEILLFISCILLFVSFLCLSSLTHINTLQTSLYNETIMAFVIILYFIGHEGTVIGLMILHVEVTPILQQPRASGIVSTINCIFVFISQSIIIGPLSSEYYTITFATECIVLLIAAIFLLIVITILTVIMHKSRNKKVVFLRNDININITSGNREMYNESTPIVKNVNGKMYRYHTINNAKNSPAVTDLVAYDFNDIFK
eukprot:415460_1